MSTSPQHRLAADFEHAPVLALVEIDRFCTECGYNLRTQPVRRDPRTQLLLTRCPECGRLHHAATATTAGSPWLHRLATLLMGVWIAALIAALIGLSIIQGVLSYVPLDELTRWGGSAGGVVLRQRYPPESYRLMMTLVVGGSVLSAYALGWLVAVACHHWRRSAYLVLLVVHAAVVAGFIWNLWSAEAPHLVQWGGRYILGLAAVRVAGGLAGALTGRALARLLVRVILPPGVRVHLSFLWLADGLPPPGMSLPSAEDSS